jgi:hypothetical protein
MAFRWLGYAQHSGALPSGFVGAAFDSDISHSLEGKKREGAPGAAFFLRTERGQSRASMGIGMGLGPFLASCRCKLFILRDNS